MGRQRRVTTEPEEQDEVSRMQAKLRAYHARTSHIQTRLLTTLDTLDTLQSSYDLEKQAMRKEILKLEIQLGTYATTVKEAQAERDDLQDAVLRLVEKIEAENGYDSCPRSRMQLSSLADPVPLRQLHKNISEEELLSFAASVINTLRNERDVERDAHRKAKEESETRMLALEAYVARLEAELESCVEHHTTVNHFPIPVFTSTQMHGKQGDEPITDDDVIDTLNATVTRNKILEIEIKSLFQRLEQARAGHVGVGMNILPAAFHGNVQDRPISSPNSEFGSHAVVSLSNDLPPPQFTSSNTGIIPSSNRNVVNPNELTLTYEPLLLEQNNKDLIKEIGLPPLQSTSREMDIGSDVELEALDNQIKELAVQVDAFEQERDALLQVISSEKQVSIPGSESSDIPKRLDEVEKECLRLREAEVDLRNEIEGIRRSAQAREEQLIEEIRNLRGQISAFALPMNTMRTNPGEAIDLLNDQGSEISMELVTPLQPTTVLQEASPPALTFPVHDNVQRSDTHPPSIPIPPSPIIYPEWSFESYVHETSPTHPTLATTEPPYCLSDASDMHLEGLELELPAAQRLAQEEALNDLQTILEEFHPAGASVITDP